ncbi:MAG: hypothetical protein KAX27_05595, partial [Candidatus Aminicenantes bacterium]|nr:hypothetical protein [Candidatus Aminicenantes bacterium]
PHPHRLIKVLYAGRGKRDKIVKLEGHLNKANQIRASIEKLIPDLEGKNVVAIVALTYGVAQHLIAYGLEKKYKQHLDTHVGLPKLLRDLGEVKTAEDFERLDTFRQGRWYGSRGNGEIVKQCLEIIRSLEEWTK